MRAQHNCGARKRHRKTRNVETILRTIQNKKNAGAKPALSY
jgi:hypothetical protein